MGASFRLQRLIQELAPMGRSYHGSHTHIRKEEMSNQPRSFKVAVVGATGAVGEVMLSILAERKFPVGEIVALASKRSAGGDVEFDGRKIPVLDLATFDPAGVDIALFSAGGGVSKQYGPKFAAAGAVVIDNSSAFRYDDDVPLVVSEVNPEAARNRPRGIIANPNCSTMQMLVALAPIHRAVGIERINVATYQSGLRRRPFGAGGTGQADGPAAQFPGHRSAALPRADRLQPDSAHRRFPGTTATPRKK